MILLIGNLPLKVTRVEVSDKSVVDGKLTSFGRVELQKAVYDNPVITQNMDLDGDCACVYLTTNVKLGTINFWFGAVWFEVEVGYSLWVKQGWNLPAINCITKLSLYKGNSLASKFLGLSDYLSVVASPVHLTDLFEYSMNNWDNVERVRLYVHKHLPSISNKELSVVIRYLEMIVYSTRIHVDDIIKVSHGLVLGNAVDSNDYWEFVHRNDPGLVIGHPIFKSRISF